jgi:hypothetical protein
VFRNSIQHLSEQLPKRSVGLEKVFHPEILRTSIRESFLCGRRKRPQYLGTSLLFPTLGARRFDYRKQLLCGRVRPAVPNSMTKATMLRVLASQALSRNQGSGQPVRPRDRGANRSRPWSSTSGHRLEFSSRIKFTTAVAWVPASMMTGTPRPAYFDRNSAF